MYMERKSDGMQKGQRTRYTDKFHDSYEKHRDQIVGYSIIWATN